MMLTWIDDIMRIQRRPSSSWYTRKFALTLASESAWSILR